MKKTIILDTNFLMAIAQFKIDIFEEIRRIADFPYQIAIIDKTITELNGIIEKQKGKDKAAAKLALTIIEKRKLTQIKTDKGYADQIIKDLADKDTIIATQDSILKKELRAKNIKVLVIRQKNHLILT